MNARKAGSRLAGSAVTTACGYEAVAMASRGRLPTLTQLQARHRALAWIILAVLAYHFIACKPPR